MSTTIILLVIIFGFLACSQGKAKKEDTELIDTDKISKSIEDFKNRPIHKNLTIDIIDQTKDDELIQVIFDNLSEKLPLNHAKEYSTVTSFNQSRQAIYVIWCLEAEVNNGGFNQFYFNSSGQFAHLTPWALKLVGANKFAELASQANEIFDANKDKIKKNQDGTLEGFSESYKDNPLNDLDKKFYKMTENLDQLQIDFIRKNKKDFADI